MLVESGPVWREHSVKVNSSVQAMSGNVSVTALHLKFHSDVSRAPADISRLMIYSRVLLFKRRSKPQCFWNVWKMLLTEYRRHPGMWSKPRWCVSQPTGTFFGTKSFFFSDASFNVTLSFSLAEQMGDNGEWVQPRWAKWLFIIGWWFFHPALKSIWNSSKKRCNSIQIISKWGTTTKLYFWLWSECERWI